MKKAAFVAKWINDFYKSAEGRKCLEGAVYIYGLIIFWTNDFWNGGVPSEPASGTISKLLLTKDGSLKYTENYKWFPCSYEIGHGICPLRSKNLFQFMHPTYLERLYEHLKSGKVWDTIAREIKPLGK